MWNRRSSSKRLDRRLYDAVKSDNLEQVLEAIKEGANPNAPVGKHGITAMGRAAGSQLNREIERALHAAGGELDPSSTLQAAGGGAVGGNRMSLLATSAYISLRRKRPSEQQQQQPGAGKVELTDGSALHDESEADIELPEAMRAAAEAPKEWEFDRSKLTLSAMLGEGQFGKVWAGEARGLIDGEAVTRVAVKQLTSEDGTNDFSKEVRIMKGLSGCDRVVRLLGVCTKEQPMLMLLELMPKGDLKTALRAARPKKTKPSPLSVAQLARMLQHISEGMSYLAKNHVVHRDLAARNCLVDANYGVKIGDFGLTRSLYTKDYYRRTESDALPVRWMSPEALIDGVFSSAGDVWSFGVVLWEVTSLAKMPYSLWTNSEVAENVVEGEYRLPRPKECPEELYALTALCWREDPGDRADFDTLARRLGELEPRMPKDKIAYQKKAPSASGADGEGGAEAAAADAAEPGAGKASSPYEVPAAAGGGDAAEDVHSAYDNAESDDSFADEGLELLDPATLEPTPEYWQRGGAEYKERDHDFSRTKTKWVKPES